MKKRKKKCDKKGYEFLHEITLHHRKPRSKSGKDSPRNISSVVRLQHRAYHTLFSNLSPIGVAAILNKTWIDPDWVLIAIPRKEVKEGVK